MCKDLLRTCTAIVLLIKPSVWWCFRRRRSALDVGSNDLGSSPGRGHCAVFLGKTLYSHSASLHPGVQMGTSEFNAGGNPAMD